MELLQREIEQFQVQPGRLLIDPLAAVIGSNDAVAEVPLIERIGSTGKGVGAATIAKIQRDGTVRLARDVPQLQPYLNDVATTINQFADWGKQILIEGTQGFGLSLHHGSYPFVTSRDTTAGTLCGETGLSPMAVDEIILVIRTYPIRVGGNSGPLNDEIDWLTVTKEAGAPQDIIERTTVTNRVRRVARFDLDMVKRAVMINRPTQIALTFIDYIDYVNHGKKSFDDLSPGAQKFLRWIERETATPVTLIGTGPLDEDIIDLRGTPRTSASQLPLDLSIEISSLPTGFPD